MAHPLDYRGPSSCLVAFAIIAAAGLIAVILCCGVGYYTSDVFTSAMHEQQKREPSPTNPTDAPEIPLPPATPAVPLTPPVVPVTPRISEPISDEIEGASIIKSELATPRLSRFNAIQLKYLAAKSEGDIAQLNPATLSTGEVGFLPSSCKVINVLSDGCLVMSGRQNSTFFVMGVSTSNMATGDHYDFSKHVGYVRGTITYDAVLGVRTAFVVEKIDANAVDAELERVAIENAKMRRTRIYTRKKRNSLCRDSGDRQRWSSSR